MAVLLTAAQQGELPDLKSFLDEISTKQLTEERKTFKLEPNDDSDDDDYPQNHFNGKKPSRAQRLIDFKREALRDFKDGNGRTAIHFAVSSNASGCDAVARLNDLNSQIRKIFPSN